MTIEFAIAIFAGVQVLWLVIRHDASRRALKSRIVGPAWLARRSLEEDVRHISDYGVRHRVTAWGGERDRIDRIEAQMREVLRLSAEVGGVIKDNGRSAFAAWIGYADVMNTRAQGKTSYTDTDVVERLFEAIGALGEIQPPNVNEPAVPTLEDVKLARVKQGSHAVLGQ